MHCCINNQHSLSGMVNSLQPFTQQLSRDDLRQQITSCYCSAQHESLLQIIGNSCCADLFSSIHWHGQGMVLHLWVQGRDAFADDGEKVRLCLKVAGLGSIIVSKQSSSLVYLCKLLSQQQNCSGHSLVITNPKQHASASVTDTRRDKQSRQLLQVITLTKLFQLSVNIWQLSIYNFSQRILQHNILQSNQTRTKSAKYQLKTVYVLTLYIC